MERWVFLCMSFHLYFVFTEGRAQHPMKHTLAWWAPVEVYHHHLNKPTNHYSCEQIIWLQSALEKWVSDHITWWGAKREDLKYADEQKMQICGSFLELIWNMFGLNHKMVSDYCPHWHILALATSYFSFPRWIKWCSGVKWSKWDQKCSHNTDSLIKTAIKIQGWTGCEEQLCLPRIRHTTHVM